MEQSGPWGGTPGTFGEDLWSLMYGQLVANGVFSDYQHTELLPYGDSSGMQVKVRAGHAFINGQWYQNTAEKLQAIRNGDTQARIDTVCLKRDAIANSIAITVEEGTPGVAPAPKALTAEEIPLAHVTVAANRTTSIAPTECVDWRLFAPRYARAAGPNVLPAAKIGDTVTQADAFSFFTSNGWQLIQSHADTGWLAVPLTAGWGQYTGGGGYPAQLEARAINGAGYVRGLIVKSTLGTAGTTYGPVGVLPSTVWPNKRHRWVVPAGYTNGDQLDCWLDADGSIFVTIGTSNCPAAGAIPLDTTFALG